MTSSLRVKDEVIRVEVFPMFYSKHADTANESFEDVVGQFS
jgi:hypothetical protein